MFGIERLGQWMEMEGLGNILQKRGVDVVK
jgi:hypothetical protein